MPLSDADIKEQNLSLISLGPIDAYRARLARRKKWNDGKPEPEQNLIVKAELGAALVAASAAGDPIAFRAALLDGAPFAGPWGQSAYLAACAAPQNGWVFMRLFSNQGIYWRATSHLASSASQEPLRIALEAGQFSTAMDILNHARSPDRDSKASLLAAAQNGTARHPGPMPIEALEWLARAVDKSAQLDPPEDQRSEERHNFINLRNACFKSYFSHPLRWVTPDMAARYLSPDLAVIATRLPGELGERLRGLLPIAPAATVALDTGALTQSETPVALLEAPGPGVKRRVLASRAQSSQSPKANSPSHGGGGF